MSTRTARGPNGETVTYEVDDGIPDEPEPHEHEWFLTCRIDGRRNGCPEHFHLGPDREDWACDCGLTVPARYRLLSNVDWLATPRG